YRRARARQQQRHAAEAPAWDEPQEPGFAPRVPATTEARREPGFRGTPHPAPRLVTGRGYHETELDYPDEADYEDVPFDGDPAAGGAVPAPFRPVFGRPHGAGRPAPASCARPRACWRSTNGVTASTSPNPACLPGRAIPACPPSPVRSASRPWPVSSKACS